MEAIRHKLFQTKAADLDQKGRVLIAVNAIGNTDADGDISAPGSFRKTLKENFDRVRWFLNHDVTILLGVPIAGREEDGYLKMEAQFNLEKQIARDTYEDYKLYAEYGKSLEHSVGLQAIKYRIDEAAMTRTVQEWKLWEFSTLTHWGANENTPLLGIKSLDEKRKLLEGMAGNASYSDQRKRNIESAYKALFELPEPTRITPQQQKAVTEIARSLNFELFT